MPRNFPSDALMHTCRRCRIAGQVSRDCPECKGTGQAPDFDGQGIA